MAFTLQRLSIELLDLLYEYLSCALIFTFGCLNKFIQCIRQLGLFKLLRYCRRVRLLFGLGAVFIRYESTKTFISCCRCRVRLHFSLGTVALTYKSSKTFVVCFGLNEICAKLG